MSAASSLTSALAWARAGAPASGATAVMSFQAMSLDVVSPDMVSLCWRPVVMTRPLQKSRTNLHDRRGEANRPMVAASQFSTDRFAMRLGLFYAAYFLYGGIQLPFFPLWLESQGLDARTIGLVIAAPTLIRIFATPVIAHQADRRRALKATLMTGSIVGLIGMAAVGLVDGTVAIFVAFTVAMLGLAPMLSLSDAYALSGLGARGRSYGPVRLWGSVAFIGGNVGAGLLLGAIAPESLIWLIVLALAGVVAAAAALTPLDAGQGPGRAAPLAVPSGRTLLRNPAFIAVALASSMIQGSHSLFYAFSTLEWRASGLSGTTIGLLWGLGVAAEVALVRVVGTPAQGAASDRADRNRRRRRDRALDRDGVRPVRCDAAGTAASARGVVRGDPSRRDGLHGAGCAARTRRHRAGFRRDMVGHRHGDGDRALGADLCCVRQLGLSRHGGDGDDRTGERALRRTALERRGRAFVAEQTSAQRDGASSELSHLIGQSNGGHFRAGVRRGRSAGAAPVVRCEMTVLLSATMSKPRSRSIRS